MKDLLSAFDGRSHRLLIVISPLAAALFAFCMPVLVFTSRCPTDDRYALSSHNIFYQLRRLIVFHCSAVAMIGICVRVFFPCHRLVLLVSSFPARKRASANEPCYSLKFLCESLMCYQRDVLRDWFIGKCSSNRFLNELRKKKCSSLPLPLLFERMNHRKEGH